MSTGNEWTGEWSTCEANSLLIGDICKLVPLRGAWEPNDRIALAMASFRLAQEHHGSIHLLFSNRRYASGNALARSLVEASLRTVWLIDDATDDEIQAILKGRDKVPLLGDLSRCFSKKSEQAFTGRHRGLLDSLTHGGPKALASQYLKGEVLVTLNAAMILQAGNVLAAAGYIIAQTLRRADLVEAFTLAIPEYK